MQSQLGTGSHREPYFSQSKYVVSSQGDDLRIRSWRLSKKESDPSHGEVKARY